MSGLLRGNDSISNLNKSQTTLAVNNQEVDSKKKGVNNAATLTEKKRATLDARHRQMIEKFASYIDAKALDVENSLLIGSKLDLLTDFFKENGTKRILFFWQASKVSGRWWDRVLMIF